VDPKSSEKSPEVLLADSDATPRVVLIKKAISLLSPDKQLNVKHNTDNTEVVCTSCIASVNSSVVRM
jgi:hypothetical protein